MASNDKPMFDDRLLEGTATRRLRNFHASYLVDTPLEARFERITRLAKVALKASAAALTIVDENCQWFKSTAGWTVTALPLDESLCRRTVARGETTVIPDLANDAELRESRLVHGSPGFRFYAGVPLKGSNGAILGTLCVMDTQPRRLNAIGLQVLSDLGELAEREVLTGTLHDIQGELLEKLSQARRKALIDPLTRVWNRRGGLLLLDHGLDQRKDTLDGVTVCMVDVDDFKQINDDYGHAVGDQVLRQVARTLVSSVRDHDIVCRLGGDEFFLLLRNHDRGGAESVAARIRRQLEDLKISGQGDSRSRVSVSLGIAVVQPEQSVSGEQVLQTADRDLYRNKKSRLRVTGQ